MLYKELAFRYLCSMQKILATFARSHLIFFLADYVSLFDRRNNKFALEMLFPKTNVITNR